MSQLGLFAAVTWEMGVAIGAGVVLVLLLTAGALAGRASGWRAWAVRLAVSVALFLGLRALVRSMGWTLGSALPPCLGTDLAALVLWLGVDRLVALGVTLGARELRRRREVAVARRTGMRVSLPVVGGDAWGGAALGAVHALGVAGLLVLWQPAWQALLPVEAPLVPEAVGSLGPVRGLRSALGASACPLLPCVEKAAVALRDPAYRTATLGEGKVRCLDTHPTVRALVEAEAKRAVVDAGDLLVLARQPGVPALLTDEACAQDLARLMCAAPAGGGPMTAAR